MKHQKWLILLVFVGLLLAACQPGFGLPAAFTPTAAGEEGQVPVTGDTPASTPDISATLEPGIPGVTSFPEGTVVVTTPETGVPGVEPSPVGTEDMTVTPGVGVDIFLTPLGGDIQLLGPELINAIQQMLANVLGISVADITVTAVEPVQWSDACLEAAFPDESCAEVVTPGFRLVMEADGETFELRTDASGRNVRLAQGGNQLQEIAIRAQLMLRQLFNIDMSQIQISNIERVTYSDACLGLNLPGQACAQVQTPGYRVNAELMGVNYELRASEADGRIYVLAPQLFVSPGPVFTPGGVSTEEATSAAPTLGTDQGTPVPTMVGTTPP